MRKNRKQSMKDDKNPSNENLVDEELETDVEAETQTFEEENSDNTSVKNSLEEELKQAKEEIQQLKDSRLRLMAEYDNFKRRTQKEKERIYGDAVVDVTEKWLPILDNLDRAAAAADTLDEQSDMQAIQSVADGIDIIRKQAEQCLGNLGIEEIQALNQAFDPELHDAIMRVDSEDHEVETVVEVFEKGYQYKDRVIRHSVVKVAN